MTKKKKAINYHNEDCPRVFNESNTHLISEHVFIVVVGGVVIVVVCLLFCFHSEERLEPRRTIIRRRLVLRGESWPAGRRQCCAARHCRMRASVKCGNRSERRRQRRRAFFCFCSLLKKESFGTAFSYTTQLLLPTTPVLQLICWVSRL